MTVTPVVVFGRTPVAVVVEIAVGDPEAELAPCEDVALHAGAIHVAKRAADWLDMRGDVGGFLYAPANVQRLENVSVILLLRTAQACKLVLGRPGGRIPSAWAAQILADNLKQWRMNASGGIRLSGDLQTTVPPGVSATLPADSNPPLRLFNHGRLQLYSGLRHQSAKLSRVGGSVTVYFEGPGDVARFKLPITHAGSLILERTPGDMPWLTMQMGSNRQDLQTRGMMDVPAGGQALVELNYNGFGSARVDVGFLFSPNIPVQCRIEIGRHVNGAVRANLELTNISGEAVFILKPSAGTVTWQEGSKILAAARPGRKPHTMLLASGERWHYETRLSLSQGKMPTAARVDLGEHFGELFCLPGSLP